MSPTLTLRMWVLGFLLEYSSTESFLVVVVGAGAENVSVIVFLPLVIFSGIMKLSGSAVVPRGSGLLGVLGLSFSVVTGPV